MNKAGFYYIFSLVEQKLPIYNSKRNTPVPPVIQLAMAIRYYATGDFQVSTGDLFGISQSTVSRKITDASRAIASLSPDIIKFPSHEESEIINSFFLNYANYKYLSSLLFSIQIKTLGGPWGCEISI